MADYLSEDEARDLAKRILGTSSADNAEVTLLSGPAGFTRFARNQISTAAESVDAKARLRVIFGRQSASVEFNDLSDEGIAAAVSRAEELARLAPADPESMPLLEPQQYRKGEALFESTVALSPAQRVEAVRAVADAADARSLVAAGFVQKRGGSMAVANTRDLFAYHRSSLASFTTTIRTEDGKGSGWAGTTHNDWAQMIPGAELAQSAMEKAQKSAGAAPVNPGAYTVVLEPTAVGNLVQLLRFSLDARAADEGRSFFSKKGGGTKLGDLVADERLTMFSDPADPDLLATPFAADGTPINKTSWIENGVLKNLAYSRYWASRAGKEPTPFAGGMKLTGGSGSTGDLVKMVEQGLLVTRFWYIRAVDRRTMLFTGMTRDGVFLIEEGQVTKPVSNMRFNESPMAVLNNLHAIGTPVRVVASESGGFGAPIVVPPLIARDFHFTSVSEAV
ncbi:MAG: TldD/PmbA family protein [Gemmatimonadales bacterium]